MLGKFCIYTSILDMEIMGLMPLELPISDFIPASILFNSRCIKSMIVSCKPQVQSLKLAKFLSWDFLRFKYLVKFQLDCFNGYKTCLGIFQVLQYKTATPICGSKFLVKFRDWIGLPVKIRNKIKVKFMFRNKGQIHSRI
jgi:hypothetical protein